MATNVDRDRASESASSVQVIDAAELARLRRIEALAKQWATVYRAVWPGTRMGEPDPPGPRPSHATLGRAERALLNEIRRGAT